MVTSLECLFTATTNAPSAHGEAAAELPLVLRATSASHLANMCFGAYGYGVAIQTAGRGAIREIGWEATCQKGLYEIWVEYAAHESRPMVLEVDGSRILSNALWECSGGWQEQCQMWRYQTVIQLAGGRHRVALTSEGPVPHIRCIAILPITNASGAADADARFIARNAIQSNPDIVFKNNVTVDQLEIPSSLNLPPIARKLLGNINTKLALADTLYNRAENNAADVAYHYLSVGASAINVIWAALQLAEPSDIRSVLDFGGAYGRCLRWLKAAFPQADTAVAEIMPEAIAFCESSLGARGCWLSSTDIELLVAPRTYDLIWAGSVLTHLSAEDNRRLLRRLVDWLNPGGVAIVTAHGRGVAARGSGRGYIPEPLWNNLRTEYLSSGFGYSDYEGQPGWGVSIASPRWMVTMLESIPDVSIVSVSEGAWGRHQDVYALQKLSHR